MLRSSTASYALATQHCTGALIDALATMNKILHRAFNHLALLRVGQGTLITRS